MFRKNYTNEQIIVAAKESISCAQTLSKLGLKPLGGNYSTIKRKLAQLNIDCSHWLGKSWNKNQKLKNWENYTSTSSLKNHLIKELGHKCESCLLSEWKDIKIPLEVHHVDGDRTNNNLNNLQLLCPNCHSITDNWRGRMNKNNKIVKREKEINQITVKEKTTNNKTRKTIEKITKPKEKYIPLCKIQWPNKEDLEQMISSKPIVSIGKELGVSDNAIRRRAKKYGIDIRSVSKWSKRHGDNQQDYKYT